MIRLGPIFRFYCTVVTVLAALLFAPLALADCPRGNILSSAAVIEQNGVDSAHLLTDGWGVPEGTGNHVPDAAAFNGTGAEVIWELNAATRVTAIDIQADSDDAYVVLGSLNGSDYSPLWQVPAGSSAGLQSRAIQALSATIRFVKLRARDGDGSYSVSELRLYCRVPTQWPAPRLVRLPLMENAQSTATYQAFSGKLVVALVGLFLIFGIAPHLKRRLRAPLLYLVIGLSALGWTHFGQFQGSSVVHSWDMFHYYTGSKYYKELGYLELYRCIAKLEHERGNNDKYAGILIRNLDDNTLYPFAWTETEAGRCRAEFSEENWEEFGKDIDTFRSQMLSPPFQHVVGDHGFNATPFHATWLSALTKPTRPTARTLRVLAQVDNIALLAAILSLAWGFGLRVAAVAAILIQVAAPWSYNWVGGGLGRHVWFALSCLGLAFLKKGYAGRGTAALTAATLLRLFPVVLLGGLGLYFISQWIRTRSFSIQARRAITSFVLTIGIGIGVVMASYGTEPLTDFADVISEHADAPGANRLGFPHLLSLGPGKSSTDLMDNRLTDPTQPWRETVKLTRKERSPLWYLSILASFAVLTWVILTIRSPWISVLATGPLLYSLQDMTSYDYMWLVLLVPVAFRRCRALAWLCGFAVFTQVIGIATPDVEFRHWLYELALFPTMLVFGWEMVIWGKLKETNRKTTPNH